jgi:hypothetical protein
MSAALFHNDFFPGPTRAANRTASDCTLNGPTIKPSPKHRQAAGRKLAFSFPLVRADDKPTKHKIQLNQVQEMDAAFRSTRAGIYAHQCLTGKVCSANPCVTQSSVRVLRQLAVTGDGESLQLANCKDNGLINAARESLTFSQTLLKTLISPSIDSTLELYASCSKSR